MAVNTSLEPIEPHAFGYTQAAHLLNRAGFGGTPQEILNLQLLGLDGAVDSLVDYEQIDDSQLPPPRFDANIIRPPTAQEQARRTEALREGDTTSLQETELDQQRRRAKDLFQMRDIEQWWVQRMILTPRPLEERLTLMWRRHFPASYRVVKDSYLMFLQNQLFRTNAAGGFSDLLLGVVRDPATLLFLSNDSNDKAAPNEKMARVLLERYVLGAGQFTEQDVRESAKALTGYGVHDNTFLNNRNQHDEGPKVVLGDRGNLDGEDLAEILLRKPACHAWISRRLYCEFVADLDTPPRRSSQTVLHELARLLAEHRLKIAPVLKRLLKSQHFYDPSLIGNKVKTPTHLLVGTARLLKTPQRDRETTAALMDRMGQRLFEPPSQDGWPQGRLWLNTMTLLARHNLCAFLVTGKSPRDRQWTGANINYDPLPMLAQLQAQTPEAVVEHLAGMLLACPLAPHRRRVLVGFIEQRKKMTSNTLIAILLLLTTLPEYQLC